MNNIRDHFNLEKNYYILKNELDEFNVEITSKIDISSNKIQSYHLYLGGLKQDCINITIFREENNINLDDRFKEYYPEYYKNFNEKHKIGLLNSIEYDKKCNKIDNLETGVGTHNLIKSAIQVVCHEFPWVEKLRFQDSSSKKCGNKSEIVSLSDLMIATQGMTWYEKHYNAYLEDEKLNSDYHSYLSNMTKPQAKLDWHLFSTLVYSFQSNNLHKIIYENSNTYLEFFNNLLLSFENRDDFCYFISGWITQFTNNIILNNQRSKIFFSNWLINILPYNTLKEYIFRQIDDIRDVNIGENFNKLYYFLNSNAKDIHHITQ